ncbi:MAG: carboxylesterase family protein [Pseudomonadota bacterium]
MKRILIVLAVLATLATLAYSGLVWFLTRPAPPLEKGQTITLSQGDIQAGIDRDNPDILQINGIPFAAPPVGDLRWRAPQAPLNWNGLRDGTQFGAECFQNRNGSGEFLNDLLNGMGLNAVQRHVATVVLENAPPPSESEDCLFLNVRTANMDGETLQPVMVWIHGGSHQSGSGSMDLYQANGLVEKGVVLVTINYRLGAFGYMAHPALSVDDPRGVSGNYGLLDQVAALKWVRDNIQSFGGDPDNVTIFGESAGAQSVTEIMSTPLSEGLFHKAILQSGASTYNANGLTTAIEGRMTMEQAGIEILGPLAEPTASAEKLRTLSAEAVVAQVSKRPDLLGYLLPTVDGVVIPTLMGEAIGSGEIHNVPILAGYNGDEATLFYDDIQRPTVIVPSFPEGHEARLTYMQEVYGPDDAAILMDAYGLSDPETRIQGEEDMLGDDLFGVHMRYLAKSNTAQGQPSYLYHFTRVPPSPRQTLGAFHASEIFFVFNSHSPLAGLTDEDKILTDAMGTYWTNFAKTGDPNGDDLPQWPLYDPATDLWMTFNPSIEVKSNIRSDKLDVMERAMVKRIADARQKINPQEETTPPAGSGNEETAADRFQP